MTAAATGADVVIVGAGSAGCVVAERLSRDSGRTVILVEAGGGRAGSASLRLDHLPIGAGSPQAVHYPSAQGFDLPRGRGLGGSSSVNGGYFVRWHRGDFAGWPATAWPMTDIETAYDHLDGGARGGGVMNVSEFSGRELHGYAKAFEEHWADAGFERTPGPWPGVGIVRVRSNRDGPFRRSAAELVTAVLPRRPNLTLLADAEVIDLRLRGGRATGVVVGQQVLAAQDVILCAGTLGTAELLARAGVLETEDCRIWEHREALVKFSAVTDLRERPPALLQTVLHTADGVEIRCYNDDFAFFIDGLPPSSQAFGVALMHPECPGSITWDPLARLRVDLGEISERDADKLGGWAQQVLGMLGGRRFADRVQSGSPRIEPVVRTSQHAWGTLPMGTATDWLGALTAVPGLRIVDASILPTAGSSGPHATIMMVATHIADRIA